MPLDLARGGHLLPCRVPGSIPHRGCRRGGRAAHREPRGRPDETLAGLLPHRCPRPGSPPAGDPSATFPPEEGHGGARVGAEGAGGVSRGGPGSPHSAAGRDFRVRRSRSTSPKTAPSSGCGRCRLLGMPRQLLPPCYQQATRSEFRSVRARGFTGGPGPGPAPSCAPPPAGLGRARPAHVTRRPRVREPFLLEASGDSASLLNLLFGMPRPALPRSRLAALPCQVPGGCRRASRTRNRGQ